MSETLAGLKPELVFKYFGEVSSIPRPSKHEGKIIAYVLATAKKLGLKAKCDKMGNVVVKKPASKGREGAQMVALQCHLDMVTEKNADKVHDFLKDPIELVRKDNFLSANGTTLGADNGIGVATSLAVMQDASLTHGPLEFLFTVDEETGLTGAHNLAAGFIKSKVMLNIDSEDEGIIYVGCAGGQDTVATWKVDYEMPEGATVAMRLSVKGLKGGHSGAEIEKNRGNAVKILNRVLLRLFDLGARLSSMGGGNKLNAIPREAEAVFCLPKKKAKDAQALVKDLYAIIAAENASVEPELKIELSAMSSKKKRRVMKQSQQAQIGQVVAALPHGVVKMSSDMAGLVETSTNVAMVETSKKKINLGTSQRSSVNSELDEIQFAVSTIMKMGGAKVKKSDAYPGWKPDLESPILKHAKSIYKSTFGKEPEVRAIHAGLECGIIGERFTGMDMISFGPTVIGAHSPDEKLDIASVERFYAFLTAVLSSTP